jgi:16S rRNA pseudouridine516 synthase
MAKKNANTLQTVLFSQGFGTRRECDALIEAGLVKVQDQICIDPLAVFNSVSSMVVRDQVWPVSEFALIMLHKPAGYECSQKPKHWPSVMDLLAPPLRLRNKGNMQPVGRLDADTTGLLLLTDDGALIHRLTSPKHHVPKVYVVRTSEPITSEQIAKLVAGVVLVDDPVAVKPSACVQTDTHQLELTLTEGKYHQVKRMIAAAGNHVEGLHRKQIGRLFLPDELMPGHWKFVAPDLVI